MACDPGSRLIAETYLTLRSASICCLATGEQTVASGFCAHCTGLKSKRSTKAPKSHTAYCYLYNCLLYHISDQDGIFASGCAASARLSYTVCRGVRHSCHASPPNCKCRNVSHDSNAFPINYNPGPDGYNVCRERQRRHASIYVSVVPGTAWQFVIHGYD